MLLGQNPGYNFAFGINDRSDVTGQFYVRNRGVQGFFWSRHDRSKRSAICRGARALATRSTTDAISPERRTEAMESMSPCS